MTRGSGSSRYTFGDSDVAVERMDLVAGVFEASSRAFLSDAVPAGLDSGTAVDLGCGPGHTTRLLAEVGRARRTVGVDGSDRYLAVARARTGGDAAVDYVRHDVTEVPLPGAPADLVYARLLLSHLPDPLALVEQWRGQLVPGGVLALDEVEDIEAPPGVLRAYEDLVVALVATEGAEMYVGRELARLGGRGVEVHVDAALAARIFRMNLGTWRDDAMARGITDAAHLDAVVAGLADLAEGVGPPPRPSTVRWVLRQVVCHAPG